MDQLDGPSDHAREVVGENNHIAHVDRLDDVSVVGVAVAEVKQQLDVCRYVIGEPNQNRCECFDHLLLVAPVGIRLVALQPREHGGSDVELDGELIVRNGLREPIDLTAQRLVINRINRTMQVVLQE